MYEHYPARINYQAACQLLMSEGLPCPLIPYKLTEQLQQTRYSAMFTTEPTLPDPYHFLFYLNRLLNGEVEAMAAFGVSGHGFYSKAMHYYLVDDHIAVFLQDGLPEQQGTWTSERQQDYETISILTIACQDAVQNQTLSPNEKLVICRSFYQPPQWGVINESGEKRLWETVENPLQSALNWLSRVAGVI